MTKRKIIAGISSKIRLFGKEDDRNQGTEETNRVILSRILLESHLLLQFRMHKVLIKKGFAATETFLSFHYKTSNDCSPKRELSIMTEFQDQVISVCLIY
jgi:hypothetical protein